MPATREHPQDEVSIEEALRLMKPTKHINEPVKAGLATELPGICRSVSEVAAMRPLLLASRLIGLPDVDETALLDIAREITASFRDMLGLEASAPAAQAPIQVTVVQDKTLSEMTARELLTALAADPAQFDDIAAALAATRLVQQAGPHPWAVTAADGTALDLDLTMSYLEYLSRPGSIPQRTWHGRRPVTLQDAFGREVLLMVNPFTGELFSGLDGWGNDWGKLPDAAHLAMIWAAGSRPRHRNLPTGELNARQLTDDLFARRQPAYIREIIEDFTAAQQHDPQLASMSRYLTQEAAASFTGVPAQPAARTARSGLDYRAMLEQIAQSHRSANSGDIRLRDAVVVSFSTMSGDVVLQNTIVLRNSSTMSGDLRGVAYVPHGVAITTMSGDDNLAVYEESYERLARRAGLIA
jgi:hypothetical protein